MANKGLFKKDTGGLAPIVGTILMISLVIVLAAVIGSQVLSVDTPDDHYQRFKDITEQNINAASLPDGLVARWNFDETYKDVTGNGNDGHAIGNVDFTNGVSGQAIKLDGTSYVEVLSSESLNITDEITLVAYVKWTIEPPSGSSYANIVCKGGEDDIHISYRLQHGKKYGTWGADNGRFEFSIYPQGNLHYIQTDNEDLKITKGEWYQIAGVYNGSQTTLYINGQVQPDKGSISGELRKYNTPLCIGSADSSRKFTGIIDEVQIYNRALSSTEIQSIGN